MGEQQRLVERLRDVFEPEDRFRGLFLTGSIGRGVDDRFSDVDTLLVVDASETNDVLESWDSVSSTLGPFVYVKQIPGAPVFNHVLPGWLRWGVTIASSDSVPLLAAQQVKVVFDKDQHPQASTSQAHMDHDAAGGVAAEFFRCLALLPVVVGRDDPVAGVSGTLLLRQLTTQMMRIVDQPGTASGALRLRDTISAEHYAALKSLPDLRTDMASVIQGHRALRDLFIPLAESALGEQFPRPFAKAALEHVTPLLDAN